MANHRQIWRTQERTFFFYRGEGGLAVINKSPLEETESLKYSGFSLAEL